VSEQTRRILVVDPILNSEPAIGRWLWVMQDTRQLTLEELEAVTLPMIDFLPEGEESSIGTILYHIALIEADWLYEEVLVQPMPTDVEALFPYPHRNSQGLLTQIRGMGLDEHLRRLESVRDLLLDVYRRMGLDDFRRLRSLPAYDVTPEWVLHHLIQHEAEHRSQIGALRIRAERHLR